MGLYTALLRPLLFRLSYERAHKVGAWAFRRGSLWRMCEGRFKVEDQRLNVELAGSLLKNPVGLAAGFDKNCDLLIGVTRLGFGYVVVGSVTLHPRQGNPKPRAVRYVEHCSLVNALGLPGVGAHRCVENLKNAQCRTVSVMASIAGFSAEEYVEVCELVQPWVDFVEINVSCPNVKDGKQFEDPSLFTDLLGRLKRIKAKPMFVKVSPYSNERDREKKLEVVSLCRKHGIDGVTATNTKKVDEPRLAVKAGGLSGKQIFDGMLKVVKDVYRETEGKIDINACGGIFSGEDAFKAIAAGATTTQIFTSLVYEGWSVVRNINLELLRLLDRKKTSLEELRGSA